MLFDFGTRELALKVAPLQLRVRGGDASDLRARCDLEETAPDESGDAYRRALELDLGHANAWVNLGRLLHEAGDPRAAAQHYRRAIELCPGNVIALFNLGVALEDLRMPERRSSPIVPRSPPARAAPTRTTTSPSSTGGAATPPRRCGTCAPIAS